MPLPSFDKQSDIPKGFEEEYEEQDGKWVPIDRSAKLKKALDEERSKREAAERAAAKAAAEATKSQAIAAGMTEEEFRKRYSSIEENIRKEYEPKVKEAEQLAAENRALKLTNVVRQMFKDTGAAKGRESDFWKLHGDEFDLSADGKPIVRAEPGKDVAKHVGAICKQRPEWMQGTRATGGGAGGLPNAPVGSGPAGAVTFEDLVKNPAAAIAQANNQ
jgi:hypothetical protein